MLAYRELDLAYKELKSNIAGDLDIKKLKALQEIVAYVKTYNWMKRTSSKEKVKFFIESGYNYEHTMKKFGIKNRNSLEVFVSNASDRLKERIGSNTINLILNGDIDIAMFQFRTGTGSVRMAELLPDALLESLPNPERNDDILLSFCKQELEFIKSNTRNSLKQKADSLDSKNLSHLRYLLESNDSRYAHVREPLFKYLLNENKGVTDLINQVEHPSIYTQPLDAAEPLIFERLETEIIETNKRLKALRAVWEKFNEYKASLEPHEKEQLNNLGRSKMDYQKVSRETGISVPALKEFAAQQSAEFEQLIGETTLDIIMAGEVERGLQQLQANVTKSLEG